MPEWWTNFKNRMAEDVMLKEASEAPRYRRNQIKQYQHPEEDILPKQPLRPKNLTKFQDQEFRSQMDEYADEVWLPEELIGQPVPEGISPVDWHKLSSGLTTQGTPRSDKDFRTHGLGGFTSSISNQPEDERPYLSIFDSWDFKSTKDPLMNYMMEGVKGKPFNIYDRIPFNPTPEGNFPAVISPRSRLEDIDLTPPNYKTQVKLRSRQSK